MEYVRGLDVSKYQTVNINWDLLRREGYRFVFLRASGPDKYPDWTGLEKDPHFDAHYERAGNAGIVRGAYHYLLPDLQGPIDLQAVECQDGIDLHIVGLGYGG